MTADHLERAAREYAAAHPHGTAVEELRGGLVALARVATSDRAGVDGDHAGPREVADPASPRPSAARSRTAEKMRGGQEVMRSPRRGAPGPR